VKTRSSHSPIDFAGMLVFLFLILGLSGCSMEKKLGDMQGSIDEMKQNTDEMKNDTAKMNRQLEQLQNETRSLGGISRSLDKQTAEMYDSLRQGDSLSARRASLQALLEAEQFPRKLSEAGKYLMSFEYQLWWRDGLDDDSKREELAAIGMRELFYDVHQFVDVNDHTPQPFSGGLFGFGEAGNRLRAFNALAASLHLMNPKQEALLKKYPGVRPHSALSMIQEALLARDVNGRQIKRLPKYVREILVFEGTATLLLEARYNFLGLLTLARLMDEERLQVSYIKNRYRLAGRVIDSKLAAKIRESFPRSERVLNGRLLIDLAQFNDVQLEDIHWYLDEANQVHKSLMMAGVQPQIDPVLKQMFQDLEFAELPAGRQKSTSAERRSQEESLRLSFETYRRHSEESRLTLQTDALPKAEALSLGRSLRFGFGAWPSRRQSLSPLVNSERLAVGASSAGSEMKGGAETDAHASLDDSTGHAKQRESITSPMP